MKQTYIELLEMAVDAYTVEHIRKYTQSVINGGLTEHGFPRLTAGIGLLIAYGKKESLKDDFIRMMDLCCKEIPVAKGKAGNDVGNDFSIKEIVLCLLALEKAEVFEKKLTDRWRNELTKIVPSSTYTCIAPVPPIKKHNWAAYTAASEQMRIYAGMSDEDAFVNNQVESQLFSFDENGMYRDPNEPMLYDVSTRLQLAEAIHFGFKGEARERLEEFLLKSADFTLKMQSVTGELPFGGRSNQFLHNESVYAALCEFYARLFKTKGDIKKAGMFKFAARKATESAALWLKDDVIYHVKNRYPSDSMYGCEYYAYFDKYMITAGSGFHMAYMLADDEIPEVEIPDSPCICETSLWFHKIFCRYGKYFVEIDTCADTHYDASGVGRIHREGVPSSLCLSVPFAKEPLYKIDIENPSPFSICGGIKTDTGFVYGYDESVSYRLTEKETADSYIKVVTDCFRENEFLFKETCVVSEDGVSITVSGNGELELCFPAFEFDGKEHTEISLSEKSVQVAYKEHRCIYTTPNEIKGKSALYANRNGHYKAYAVCGENSISLNIKLI